MKKTSKIRNIYLYVKKEKVLECIKYGMKLSEHSNVSFYKNNMLKKGVIAYISPKDSDKYFNENYEILRVTTNAINIYVNNSSVINSSENTIFDYSKMYDINDYILGNFLNPELVISSSILPEYIFKYNRIIDVPLLVDNSKELYLNKEIDESSEVNDLTFDMLKNNI